MFGFLKLIALIILLPVFLPCMILDHLYMIGGGNSFPIRDFLNETGWFDWI